MWKTQKKIVSVIFYGFMVQYILNQNICCHCLSSPLLTSLFAGRPADRQLRPLVRRLRGHLRRVLPRRRAAPVQPAPASAPATPHPAPAHLSPEV